MLVISRIIFGKETFEKVGKNKKNGPPPEGFGDITMGGG